MTPTMTPTTPVIERSPDEARDAPQAECRPIMPPSPPPQPYSWQPPVLPAWQQRAPSYEPTAGQRLALAIVSLALCMPLSAIAIGTAVPLTEAASAWLGILTSLLALLLVCVAVVGVNVVFNADLLKSVRR